MMALSSKSEQALLRDRVLEVLEHFWWPLSPVKELAPYLQAVYGEVVKPSDLQRLLAAERQALVTGIHHEVWLCLGIRPDAHSDPQRWARSDWPMWVRIVDPKSEQLRNFWLLLQLYRAPVAPGAPGSEPLVDLWIRLAEHLPTDSVLRLRQAVEDQEPDFVWTQNRYSIWAEVADELFDRSADEDRQRRQMIAEGFRSLDTTSQLFGVS